MERKVAELTKLHQVIEAIENIEREVEKVQELEDRGIGSSQTDQILMGDSLMLNSVGKNLKWATHIRKTQTHEQQAEIFYQAYRVILVNQDTYKQKIMQLKEEVKRVERGNVDQEHHRKKMLALLERNKALKT